MGSKKQVRTAQPNYAKKAARALRALTLPMPRTVAAWVAQAEQAVGSEEVDYYLSQTSAGQTDADTAHATWCAETDQRTRLLWGSWFARAIEARALWLAEHLGPVVAKDDEPLLVEIGAGLGFEAAVLSAALNVPIITVDPMCGSARAATRLAERTGGRVEPHEKTAGDLAAVLNGRTPTAAYGSGVLRHLQKHSHDSSEAFSYVSHMEQLQAKVTPSPEVVAVLKALNGADLFGIEVTCHDWLGEIDGVASHAGYHLQLPQVGPLFQCVLDDQRRTVPLLLTRGGHKPTPAELLARVCGVDTQPTPHFRGNGEAAELARLATTSLRITKGRQLTLPDDHVIRLELSTDGTIVALYEADNQGARMFATWPAKEATVVHDVWLNQVETFTNAGATSVELAADATQW